MPDPALHVAPGSSGLVVPTRLTSSTRLVGILGWPVGHTRSPAMHNHAHRALGVDAHYLVVPVPPADLAEVVRAMQRLGWRGANVTIPHKVAALEFCDSVSADAELIGAVNVLTFDGGEVIGDNTDARGWLTSLESETNWRGGAALVLGTGGAARAVVSALGTRKVPTTIVGRRDSAVEGLVALASRAGAPTARGLLVDDGALREAVDVASLVVNATPLGMHEERLPEPMHELRAGQTASDLVYAPLWTPFLSDARDRGATAHGGIGMLVHQAALAFEQWHGIPAPVQVLREGLR